MLRFLKSTLAATAKTAFILWAVTTVFLDADRAVNGPSAIAQPRFPYTQDQVTGVVTWLFPQLNVTSTQRNSAALLAVPYNLYVAATGGNDGNDCQASSVSATIANRGPCATVQHAVNVAANLDGFGNLILVNVTAGTFNENVSLSGPMVGAANGALFVSTIVSTKKIRIQGAGVGSTIIKGVPSISGQGYCYVILADNYAALGLKDLSIDATTTVPTNTCYSAGIYQTALYAQMNASIYIDGNVEVLGATANGIALEEKGNVLITPGCQVCGTLTFKGTYGVNVMNADSHSMIQTDSTVNISGTVVAQGGTGAFINLNSGSIYKNFAATPIAYPNTGALTGRLYNINGLSVIFNNTNANFGVPGSAAALRQGGSRIQSMEYVACLGGAAGCPNTNAATGLGAGSIAFSGTNKGLYSGLLQITTGAGAGNNGAAFIGFPDWAFPSNCFANLTSGSGSWDARATVRVGAVINMATTGSGVSFQWDNNGVALDPATKTYFIPYVCATAN